MIGVDIFWSERPSDFLRDDIDWLSCQEREIYAARSLAGAACANIGESLGERRARTVGRSEAPRSDRASVGRITCIFSEGGRESCRSTAGNRSPNSVRKPRKR